MAYNKLHKKDFTIAVKTGTDANKTKFAKESAKGELYFATDSGSLYGASSDAGASDSIVRSFGPSREISTESTTARTLSDSDNGKIINCTNGNDVTITISDGLTSGFSCTLVQSGTGVVRVEAGGTATLQGYNSANATAGQYASVNIYPIGTDTYILDGTAQSISPPGINDLHYTGGIYFDTNATYYISTQPIMHFDAAILDGSNPVNNPSIGSAVSTWGDRSGQSTNYDATQSTGSAQPTFNVSGVDKYVSFDGGDFMGLANSVSRSSTQTWTIVQVGQVASTSNAYYAAPNVDNSYGSVQLGVYSDGNIYVRGTSIASGKDYSALNMLTATRNGSDLVEVFRDGNSSEGTRTTSDTFVFNNIGRSGSTMTTGDIYECLLFNTILSSTDLNTINSYLANKYSGLPTLTSW